MTHNGFGYDSVTSKIIMIFRVRNQARLNLLFFGVLPSKQAIVAGVVLSLFI